MLGWIGIGVGVVGWSDGLVDMMQLAWKEFGRAADTGCGANVFESGLEAGV